MDSIVAISASVNYSKYLSFTYRFNQELLKNYISKYYIVTDFTDNQTYDFCKNNNIDCYRTDSYYSFFGKPATMNRAGAINDLIINYEILKKFQWILLLDADIILNSNLFSSNKNINYLYGCSRKIYITEDDYMTERCAGEEPCKHLGFFQLFNIEYLIEQYKQNKYSWDQHFFISNYNVATHDGLLANFFPNKIDCGTVAHIGLPYKNWDGQPII